MKKAKNINFGMCNTQQAPGAATRYGLEGPPLEPQWQNGICFFPSPFRPDRP